MASDWEVISTCGAQLVYAERTLAAAGSLAPWQDAVELLSHVLDVSIPVLLAQPAKRLSRADVRRYASLVRRRAMGESLPRITSHVTFMGLDLAIGPTDPLIPAGAERRAEIALEWGRHHTLGELAAAEIGTGCGAVALALAALEPRFTRIYALDPSPTVLETATANGARYLLNLVISWVVGAGLGAIPEPVDLIVCGQPGGTEPPGDAHHAGTSGVPAPSARLLGLASAKLRPGGALIWGLERVREAESLALIDLAFPDAQVWVDPRVEGEVIAVVQLAAQPANGAAANDLR